MSLKVGDKVGVMSGNYGQCYIRAVAKVTPSGQVTLDNGDRFTPNGRKVGASNWSMEYLRPADECEQQAAATLLYDALEELRHRAERIAVAHGAGSGPSQARPLTAAERAELLAIIDRCSAGTTGAGA